MNRHQSSSSARDAQYSEHAVSLIDLTKILIRRRWVLAIVFLVIAAGGTFFALASSADYDYTSVVRLSQSTQGKAIVPPTAVISELGLRYIPEVTGKTSEGTSEWHPEFQIENPDGTALIVLQSTLSSDSTMDISALHRKVIDKLRNDQLGVFEHEKLVLNETLELLQGQLKALQTDPMAGIAIAELLAQQREVKQALSSLVPPEVIALARKGQNPTGMPKILIVVVSLVLGAMLGIFAAFFAEFVSRVRQSLV